jgi:hypothetical protein
MIKFFKKIRRTLLNQNKTGKYLKYAVGEIVLVMIGILLALQVSNWNTERKIEKEEIAILNNLLENLSLAKKQSKIEISNENLLKKSLLVALGKSKRNLNTLSDSLIFNILWNSNPNTPVLNSYTDIKNTGKTGIVTNRKIRESFTNLELSLTGLTSLINDRLTLQQMRIDDIIANDLNFVRLLKSMDANINTENESPNNYLLILSNSKTRNLLALKLSLTYDAIKLRQELDNDIDALIQLLETELNNSK